MSAQELIIKNEKINFMFKYRSEVLKQLKENNIVNADLLNIIFDVSEKMVEEIDT